MEGQCKLDSHDLNANGFLGLLVFDFGEKSCNNRKVVENMFYHIAYLLISPSGVMCRDNGLSFIHLCQGAWHMREPH